MNERTNVAWTYICCGCGAFTAAVVAVTTAAAAAVVIRKAFILAEA